MTCAAKPRGFNSVLQPWDDRWQDNPCGKKQLTRSGLPTPVAADGCQLWLPLEETVGPVAADLSGGGRNFNYIGNPSLVPPGPYGGSAVTLNGVDQYLDNLVGTFPSVGDIFTIMCWARPVYAGARAYALFSRNGAYLIRLQPVGTSGGGWFYTVYGLGTVVSATPNVNYFDGLWHHFCVAKNGATACKLYYDGNDVSGTVTNQTTPSGGASTVRIGASHNGPVANEAFPGSIDEPMIFNTYLSAARIAEFALGRDVSAEGLCPLHWQMKNGQAMQQPIALEP